MGLMDEDFDDDILEALEEAREAFSACPESALRGLLSRAWAIRHQEQEERRRRLALRETASRVHPERLPRA
jgi:hypothetical protein